MSIFSLRDYLHHRHAEQERAVAPQVGLSSAPSLLTSWCEAPPVVLAPAVRNSSACRDSVSVSFAGRRRLSEDRYSPSSEVGAVDVPADVTGLLDMCLAAPSPQDRLEMRSPAASEAVWSHNFASRLSTPLSRGAYQVEGASPSDRGSGAGSYISRAASSVASLAYFPDELEQVDPGAAARGPMLGLSSGGSGTGSTSSYGVRIPAESVFGRQTSRVGILDHSPLLAGGADAEDAQQLRSGFSYSAASRTTSKEQHPCAPAGAVASTTSPSTASNCAWDHPSVDNSSYPVSLEAAKASTVSTAPSTAASLADHLCPPPKNRCKNGTVVLAPHHHGKPRVAPGCRDLSDSLTHMIVGGGGGGGSTTSTEHEHRDGIVTPATVWDLKVSDHIITSRDRRDDGDQEHTGTATHRTTRYWLEQLPACECVHRARGGRGEVVDKEEERSCEIPRWMYGDCLDPSAATDEHEWRA
eukprot:CAMPEP_0178998996 /NCGR_PEP_ID=MMETSP0795-20121207/9812_1 /TAXON_ID=88552 /ORGANISM="Amoebophrya sp., Strain Ameob2" /LENGTH=468 /DNA_ID=CAMNT_0020691715 /DNA_START=33 /DNA_END=1441 /DNA_ORIENTATION=+